MYTVRTHLGGFSTLPICWSLRLVVGVLGEFPAPGERSHAGHWCSLGTSRSDSVSSPSYRKKAWPLLAFTPRTPSRAHTLPSRHFRRQHQHSCLESLGVIQSRIISVAGKESPYAD